MKISKELIQELCKYISNGLSNTDASIMCNIAESTFYYWLKKARETKEEEKQENAIYLELLENIKKAEIKFKAFHLNNITKASEGNWTASAWILERKYKSEYGKLDMVANVDLSEVKEIFKECYGSEINSETKDSN